MPKSLPARPSLEQLKNQAKDLLKAHKSGDPAATRRLQENHPRWTSESEARVTRVLLSDAQLVIAREHGFPSWPALKRHVETIERATDPMEMLAASVRANDAAHAAEILTSHPELKPRLDEPMPNFGFGATLLMAAVQRANKDMVEALLRAGANINARSHWWAGSFGVLDDDHGLAAYLIARGAIVDAHSAARLGLFDRLRA